MAMPEYEGGKNGIMLPAYALITGNGVEENWTFILHCVVGDGAPTLVSAW